MKYEIYFILCIIGVLIRIWELKTIMVITASSAITAITEFTESLGITAVTEITETSATLAVTEIMESLEITVVLATLAVMRITESSEITTISAASAVMGIVLWELYDKGSVNQPDLELDIDLVWMQQTLLWGKLKIKEARTVHHQLTLGGIGGVLSIISVPLLVHEQIHFLVPLCGTNPDGYIFKDYSP